MEKVITDNRKRKHEEDVNVDIHKDKDDFFDKFDKALSEKYPKDSLDKVEHLLSKLINSKLINFDSFTERNKKLLIYFFIVYLKYLNSSNNYINDYVNNNNLKNCNNNKSLIIQKLNKKSESTTKKDLIGRIEIIENIISSDINKRKELMDHFLRLKNDINENNKKIYSIEINKTRQQYLLNDNKISENIISKEILYNNLKKIVIEEKINRYLILLKGIKNKILETIDNNIKKELTEKFTRFDMYNNILNNFSVNSNYFNDVNNNIEHFDKNNNICPCSKCKEIKLFQKIYHELLLVQTNI